jgi:hypothetical protein
LHSVLNQVTKRYLELGEERFEASYIASQYAQYMPQTFQRDEVYEIVGDMITAVAALKRSYDLHEKEDPISWLNSNQPDWKSEFPLPLNDATGIPNRHFDRPTEALLSIGRSIVLSTRGFVYRRGN